MLNPKPPDPEAAFAFQTFLLPVSIRRQPPKVERLPNLEALMSRPLSTSNRPNVPVGFDFDVVTDSPADLRRAPARPGKAAAESLPASQEAGVKPAAEPG